MQLGATKATICAHGAHIYKLAESLKQQMLKNQRMKKLGLLILTAITFASCSTTKQISNPNEYTYVKCKYNFVI
jgi:hypothetical protein